MMTGGGRFGGDGLRSEEEIDLVGQQDVRTGKLRMIGFVGGE